MYIYCNWKIVYKLIYFDQKQLLTQEYSYAYVIFECTPFTIGE